MGLLSPLLLLLAAAAAVPLLLHLLQRHQGPRIIFPALRYLRRAERESARKIRLRQLLLMLLRIMTVLLVAFAAARPFVRVGGVGHAPTAVAIILDNSMSTAVVEGEQRIIDGLKARALEMLADAGPDDRFWLLRPAGGEPALAGDALATAQRIRETEPSAGAADLSAALTHAQAVLAAGAEARASEIHMLTDLQATSFSAPSSATGPTPPIIVWHPGTAAPPNHSVASVEVGGGLAPIADQRINVAAEIAGAGEAAVAVRLNVEGRLVAAASARPGAAAVLAMPARAAGAFTGHVEIDADALHADDTRYFAARVLPPPAVSVSSPLPFVDAALEVLAAAGRVRRAGSSGGDVAVVPGAVGLESTGARTAAIVLPPSTPVEVPAVNRRLAAAGIPWRFQSPVAGEARFSNGASTDPLLRTLASTRLRLVYPLTVEGAANGDSVLLRLADGTPWAVRGERRIGGIYVVLATPLTEEASTVPTSAAMLPLLERLTAAWTLALPPRSDVAPGDEVTLPPTASAVQLPDGTRDRVTAGGAYRLPLDPGVYRVLRDDSLLTAFAVNVPASESDLGRLDERALEARLPGWTTHVTDNVGAWRRATFRERLGNELWKPLLFAALIVLLVETAVAAAGAARRSDAGTAPAVEAEAR